MVRSTLPRGLSPAHVTLLLGRLEAAHQAGQLALSLGQFVAVLAAILPEEFAVPPGCDASKGPPGTPKKAAALAARAGSRRRLWAAADADYVRDDRLGRESVCTKQPRHGPGTEVNHPQALGRFTRPGTVLEQTSLGVEKRPDLCENDAMLSQGKFRWRVTIPGCGLDVIAAARSVEVLANTRSEARGAAKPLLGIKPKEGLPANVRVEKLGPVLPAA